MSDRYGSDVHEPDDVRFDDGSFDATARIVDADGADDERVVEAALRPKRLADLPVSPRSASSSPSCWRPLAAGVRHLTTSCSPARPGSARRPWP